MLGLTELWRDYITENSLPQETPSKHRLMRSFTMVISKCLDVSVKTAIKYTKKKKSKENAFQKKFIRIKLKLENKLKNKIDPFKPLLLSDRLFTSFPLLCFCSLFLLCSL